MLEIWSFLLVAILAFSVDSYILIIKEIAMLFFPFLVYFFLRLFHFAEHGGTFYNSKT